MFSFRAFTYGRRVEAEEAEEEGAKKGGGDVKRMRERKDMQQQEQQERRVLGKKMRTGWRREEREKSLVELGRRMLVVGRL
jgi:hypothetical protein